MIVKIGVSFSAREARELVANIEKITNDYGMEAFPVLVKLSNKLTSPLTPDKIPAVVENNNGN